MYRVIILISIVLISIQSNSYSQKLKKLENNYYILVGNNINLRAESSTNAKIIRQLKIAYEVKLIKRSGKYEKSGEIKGEWVYVDIRVFNEDHSDTIKGWMLDYYLSDGTDFKKISTFKECMIEDMVGDSLLSYRFHKNGRYERRDYDPDTGKYQYYKGSLYEYRKVIIAHDETGLALADWIFYLNDKQIMCSNHGGRNNKQICAQEVAEKENLFK